MKMLGLGGALLSILATFFLGFYQCGGYLWVKEMALVGVVLACLLSVFAAYRHWADVPLAPVSTGLLLALFLFFAWHLGQALYVPPHSIQEFFGPGC